MSNWITRNSALSTFFKNLDENYLQEQFGVEERAYRWSIIKKVWVLIDERLPEGWQLMGNEHHVEIWIDEYAPEVDDDFEVMDIVDELWPDGDDLLIWVEEQVRSMGVGTL